MFHKHECISSMFFYVDSCSRVPNLLLEGQGCLDSPPPHTFYSFSLPPPLLWSAKSSLPLGVPSWLPWVWFTPLALQYSSFPPTLPCPYAVTPSPYAPTLISLVIVAHLFWVLLQLTSRLRNLKSGWPPGPSVVSPWQPQGGSTGVRWPASPFIKHKAQDQEAVSLKSPREKKIL